METNVQTVTPAWAKQALTMNTNNRPLSEHAVRLYANAMLRGEWLCNGESIIFDDVGFLLNGQHRLHACIRYGISFDAVIVRGVSNAAFKTMDDGRKRRAADVLAISGEKNAVTLATAGRAYIALTIEGRAMYEITKTQILNIIDAVPQIRTHTSVYVGFQDRIIPAGIIGVVAHLDILHGRELAEDFLTKSMTGADLQNKDPELMLRSKFIYRKRGVRMQAETAIAYMIKAANAKISGKQLGVLKYVDDEAIPTLIGMKPATQQMYTLQRSR